VLGPQTRVRGCGGGKLGSVNGVYVLNFLEFDGIEGVAGVCVDGWEGAAWMGRWREGGPGLRAGFDPFPALAKGVGDAERLAWGEVVGDGWEGQRHVRWSAVPVA
jgi:hypothetical protein